MVHAGGMLDTGKTLSRYRLAFLVTMVVIVGILHTITPTSYWFWHTLYRRLSYLPIVIGAVWFGVRGGLVFSLLACIAFIPHLWHFSGRGTTVLLAEATEIPLYIGAGLLVGYIAGRESLLRRRYQDISQRLEQSYARLHRESALLLELEGQLAASQKMSALGELSASIAHEIKNPLAAIRGTVEIILDEMGPDHPKREFALILLKETERLATAVNNVLAYSRKEGGLPGQEALEPLAPVVERTCSLIAGQLKKKRAVLESFIAPDTASMEVPADRLSQVLLNLLLNACEAVDEGGMIRVRSWLEDGGLRLEVADDGPGIPPHRREEVFKPFHSGKPGGTGLGLAITSRIIAACGGVIKACESDLGGAALRIAMPAGGCRRQEADDRGPELLSDRGKVKSAEPVKGISGGNRST